MKVTVKLFASFRRHLPPQAKGYAFEVSLPEGKTVDDLLKVLDLPAEVPKITLVNGEHVTGNRVLQEDEEVSIFPPLAGGGR